MDEKKIHQYIARELAGETTPAEQKRLRKWLMKGKRNRELYLSIQQYWHHKHTERRHVEVVKDRLLRRLELTGDPGPMEFNDVKPLRKRQNTLYKQYVKIAAVLIVGITFIWGGYHYYTAYLLQHPQLSDTKIEKIIPYGQKEAFVLEDGTIVKLNSGSKLTYPEKFSAANRTVTLEGEAFFEVAEDRERPFIVRSGSLTTSVLGTVFNIKAYPEDESVQVALLSGKVRVEHKRSTEGTASHLLLPNEMLTLHKSQNQTQLTGFDADAVMAWKNKTLYFKDADLAEIVKTLERWYGVSFLIAHELTIKRKFTGKFENRSLEYVLNVLSYESEFEYSITDKIVTIKKINR